MTRNLMLDIFQEIAAERGAQDVEWGEQNHPLICPAVNSTEDEHHGYAHLAEEMRHHNAYRAEIGALSWDCILREEVYEAFAETDIETARGELIQAAAVIVAAVESIDRRYPRGAKPRPIEVNVQAMLPTPTSIHFDELPGGGRGRMAA